MAEVKLTIEEDTSPTPAAEKQEGQQKGQSKDGDQQQADVVADPSPPSTMSEFYQQIAKLNIGRFKLFTWFALLAAFISLSNGQSTIRRKSSENYYGDIVLYESTYPNPVWNRAMSLHFVLLVISTGSLLFHGIQRCMSKCLVTLALMDICLSLFSTVVLSIQCWQIMVGHVSVNWDHGISFPFSLNFAVWCTSAMAIVLTKVCFCRTISALKQTKLWVAPSNYAKAHPGCSALDAAYARFWPIGLQKLAQMLIGVFVFMVILLGAVGLDNRDDYNLIFGIYTLVCLFQWAFHTARTRFFAKETSAGLALACFVDCLLSGLGLLFQMVIYYNFPTPFRATFFTWLSLICGSMFAFTICFNLLLLFRHRNAIGANIAAVWGKLIKQLRKKMPRSVPLRISVSVNFTVVKKDEEEKKAKKMNNDADDNNDVEAAMIGDEEENNANEEKVEEDGKMEKEEDDGNKKMEEDKKKEEEEKDVKKVVDVKPNEDGISFEEVLEEGEEDAYSIV